MEEKIFFQSEVTYDLKTMKEFNRINQDSHGRSSFFEVIFVVCLLVLLSGVNNSFTARNLFLLSLFALILWLVQWFRNRDGGISYKRMLRNNNDQIPGFMITVHEDGIHTRSHATDREIFTRFDTCRFIVESKQLLIVVDDLRSAHIFDKSTLTGGSRDDLVAFLRQKCPKMKKRIRFGRLGRILKYLNWALTILALLASVAVLLHIPEKLQGQITNNMSYEKMAEELAPLGVTISPATIEKVKYYEDQAGSVPFYPDDYPKVLDLLCWEGYGTYDETTWEWTPSTSGVYWFDLEVMDCSAIYANFLRGLDAMDETLRFFNVTEDYSAVDMDTGMGIVTFSFDYQNQHYILNAQYEYDWFDTNMLAHIGRILQQDSDPKDLWYTFDGAGVLLYYGTLQEVTQLEQKTGLYFLDPVNQPLYGY